MSGSTINELLAEFKDPPVSQTELRRRRAEILRKFYDHYNFSSWSEIEDAIRTNSISESALVDEWIDLRAALEATKLLKPERPPKRRDAEQRQASRESGSILFRTAVSRPG